MARGLPKGVPGLRRTARTLHGGEGSSTAARAGARVARRFASRITSQSPHRARLAVAASVRSLFEAHRTPPVEGGGERTKAAERRRRCSQLVCAMASPA
eukprot:scaffold27667_cov102-Isochrysis_galbana.AAC.6